MLAVMVAAQSVAITLPSLPSLPPLPQSLAAYGDAAAACAAVATSPNDATGWRRLGKLLHVRALRVPSNRWPAAPCTERRAFARCTLAG